MRETALLSPDHIFVPNRGAGICVCIVAKHQLDRNKMLREDWFDLVGLNEALEHLAPGASGRAEHQENILLFRSCLLFCLLHQLVRGWSCGCGNKRHQGDPQ